MVKTRVVAEIGVNHNGDVELARRIIDMAADAGADAVKFQTFLADRLATGHAAKAAYQIANTGSNESQQSMLRSLELSRDAHEQLFAHCRSVGIDFLSTPMDEQSAEFLVSLGVKAIKVGSGDLTNLPFLEFLDQFGLPLYVSTGMSTLDDVRNAVEVIKRSDLLLMHCTSNYPAAFAEINLRAMATMADTFHVPVGYSDHSLGSQVATCAVALGATLIEKHVTVDKSLPGPDQRASMDGPEFRAFVQAIRTTEDLLGDGVKRPMPSELETRQLVRRSLVTTRSLPAGYILEFDDLAAKRPGTGIEPGRLSTIVGRKLTRAVASDTVLQEGDLA